MFETKYSKFLTILLIVIIIAIIGLLGYLGFNYYKNYSIKNDADKFVSSYVEEVAKNDKNNVTNEGGSISENINASETSSSNGANKMYKGYEVIGSIEIPKTGISYPVYKDPPTVQKLEISVGALSPQNAELNKPGNVVIIGHNYRNGLFFSNNKKLAKGDKIYIKDLEGNRVTYVVYDTFYASKDDTSFYNRDTDGAMEITLSTCHDDDSSQRLIIVARAE